MKNKGILRFKHSTGGGMMHYIIFDDRVVTLTENSSKKANEIAKTGEIAINFKKLGGEFNNLKVRIEENNEVVKNVFDEMIELKNSHFKKFSDDLVALFIET